MSSYLVENEIFEACSDHAYKLFLDDYFKSQFYNDPIYHMSSQKKYEKVKEIFSKLKEISIISVAYQYDLGQMDFDKNIQIQLKAYQKGINTPKITDIQFYKYLTCIRYQIEFERLEGIRDDLKPYLKWLNKLITKTAIYMVEDSEDYKNAKWS